MQLLDGKKVSAQLSLELKDKFSFLSVVPRLVIFQVGEDPASTKYVTLKKLKGEELGVSVEVIKLDKNISSIDIISQITQKNNDDTVHGIMVQLPLPNTLDTPKILEAIDPQKDADGLTDKNSLILPAAVRAICTLLTHYNLLSRGKNAAIINKSRLIGLPLSTELKKLGLVVTNCDINTPNIQDHTKNSDLIITATGQENLITGSWVKPGAVVVDVGFPHDVDFASVSQIASFITPPVGGVGPVTVISLFQNLYDLIKP